MVDWAIEGPDWPFIAVDCGTSDGALSPKMEAAGIDVIVCDHHTFPADGNVQGLMLNPARDGETYPNRALCGAGVAFKLVQALHAGGVRGAMPTRFARRTCWRWRPSVT